MAALSPARYFFSRRSLAVTVRSGHVEVLAEPTPYAPRRNAPARRLIVKEFTRRRGDPSTGGSTRTGIMTAYRQQALSIARALAPAPLRPRDLRPDHPDALSILSRNVYGWFERTARGVYGLTPAGHDALRAWPEHRAGDDNGIPRADG